MTWRERLLAILANLNDAGERAQTAKGAVCRLSV